MSRFKKFIIAFDNHGDLIDSESSRIFFSFMKDWNPDIRIHGGDCFDFRPLRRKADDEERRESLRADWDAGTEFLERFQPQHLLLGNHDARLYDLVEKGGPAADYAYELCHRLETTATKMGCKVYPYHKRLGVLRIGRLKVVHGFYAGMYACKQHALVYGSVLHGHTHTAEEFSIPGLDRRVGRACGALCDLTKLEYSNRTPSSLRHTNGFPYGLLDTKTGEYHVVQAEKIGGHWVLPTEFKIY